MNRPPAARRMQLLCPACHTPVREAPGRTSISCDACAVEIDVSRLGTVAGKPRFLPERDRAGAVVGDFSIVERLGAGGMGTVWRAEGATGQVAVKFLAAGLAGDSDLVVRFQREIQVLETLGHPAIVRVLASGDVDGVPWFAMTLVTGSTCGSVCLDKDRCRHPRRPLSSGACWPRWRTPTTAA
jgi:serine/threonine protein kinase